MRKLVAGLLLVFVPSVVAADRPEPTPRPWPTATTTLILVRHAEKRSDGSDPGLSRAGRKRSLELARMLEQVEIAAIFATQYRRTRETAEAVARRSGLEVTVDAVRSPDLDGHARRFVRELLTAHGGKTVLVVGHSNTLPALIGALGLRGVLRIDERTYDDLFVVTVPTDGDARLLQLRYGEPSRRPTTGD